MKKELILLFLIFLSFGCQKKIKIIVDGQNPYTPIFTCVDGKKTIRVNTFGIYKKKGEQWSINNAVWEFKLAPGSYEKVEKIVYGKLPKNFTESKNVESLKENISYVAAVSGDVGHGLLEFKIINKDSVAKLLVIQ